MNAKLNDRVKNIFFVSRTLALYHLGDGLPRCVYVISVESAVARFRWVIYDLRLNPCGTVCCEGFVP